MGLYMQKNEQRSELQQRVAAELREKAARSQQMHTKNPDGVEDSKYMERTKKTTTLAGAWVVIVVLVIAVGVLVIWRSTAG